MINETHRLDVQKWNELRKKFESDPDCWKVWRELNGVDVIAPDDRDARRKKFEVEAELRCLSVPGGSSSSVITSGDDFKGGAISPLTWLYALRAHMRKVPRLHLHGKTLDEQKSYLERAVFHAPNFLGVLLTKQEG